MSIKACLAALLVVAIWGFNFIPIKLGVAEIPGLALLALRYLFTGLIFAPFMKWPGKEQAIAIMLVGVFMGILHHGLLYVGMKYMPSGLMSLLTQSNVIFATLIAMIFFKENIGWRTWAGIGIGLLGLAVLTGSPDLSAPTIGYVLAFASAFFAALALTSMKKVDEVRPMTYLALSHLPIAPVIILMSLVTEGTDWITHPETVNWTIVSAVLAFHVFVLGFSHVLWQKLMTKFPMSVIVPWTLLIPVFAVFPAAFILDEPITTTIMVGGAFTIAGIGIITFRKIKRNAT